MVPSARAFQSVTKSARDIENGASSRLKQASSGRKGGRREAFEFFINSVYYNFMINYFFSPLNLKASLHA
jgi:hypothetical protein